MEDGRDTYLQYNHRHQKYSDDNDRRNLRGSFESSTLRGRTYTPFVSNDETIIATYNDVKTDRLYLFTNRDYYELQMKVYYYPTTLTFGIGFWNFKAVSLINKTSIDKDVRIDAMFGLGDDVYFKLGQFFWDRDNESSVRPIIHHPTHNPRGIVSIDHCGWSDEESLRLLTLINASRNADYTMQDAAAYPVGRQPLENGTESGLPGGNGNTTQNITAENRGHEKLGISSAKTGILMFVWILFFTVSCLVIMIKRTVSKPGKRSSDQKTNRSSNNPATFEPLTIDSSVNHSSGFSSQPRFQNK